MAQNRLLITGNEAVAEAAIQAGCRFYAGYPITPQNELTAYMAEHMPRAGGCFIQAESELAAINMVFGASATGARSMTSSSSPGISLKQEGISYIAGAQLPAVIVNVMRGGPGLGNIAPAQSDYFQATRGGGHGDYYCIVLAPSTVQEAYDLMFRAFDLADKYRTPVIILSDGMLGQMMEPVRINPKLKAGVKVYPKPWALTGCKDRDPNVVKSFYLKEGELEKFNISLQKKYREISQKEQRFEASGVQDAKIVLVAYGTMARIARSALESPRLKDKRIGLIRPISLWPFPNRVFQRLRSLKKKIKILTIEMSCGQMLDDVKLAVEGQFKVDFLGRSGGGIPGEEEIVRKINTMLKSHD